MRRALVGLFIGCLVPLAGSATALAVGPGYVDLPLNGPTELRAGESATYSSSAGGCTANAPKLTVDYTLNGDWTTRPTTQSLTRGGANVKLGMTAGDFSGDGEMVISVFCPLSDAKIVRYRATVTVIGTGGPDGGELRTDSRAGLTFKRAELAPGEQVSGQGETPCPGGAITYQNLIVLTGSGRWAQPPQYRVFMNGGSPVMDVTKMGTPVFDGETAERQTIKGEVVCESADARITYEGYVDVIDRAPAGTTAPAAPPVASNVRRAIAVNPASVERSGTIIVSNTAASTCDGLVFLQGSSGLQRSDAGKYEFGVSRGSESGDLIRPDGSGNWALSFTFADDFLGNESSRRLTLSLACGRRNGGTVTFDFLYQPAAFSVVDQLVAAPAPGGSAGSGGSTSTPSSNDTVSPDPAGQSSQDASGSGAGAPVAGGSGASDSNDGQPSLGTALAIPTGDVVDAVGNQILPRAYLDGDTQQLIEFTTGIVIGEYDVVSGQFVDPNTGEVTGIVDPVSGELIDAATGILIGVSVAPDGASNDPTLLGLGSQDDGGANVLVIVLAAVAGALLIAVIALVLSRRRTTTASPPAE